MNLRNIPFDKHQRCTALQTTHSGHPIVDATDIESKYGLREDDREELQQETNKESKSAFWKEDILSSA